MDDGFTIFLAPFFRSTDTDLGDTTRSFKARSGPNKLFRNIYKMAACKQQPEDRWSAMCFDRFCTARFRRWIEQAFVGW
jgi:hypothetical protein